MSDIIVCSVPGRMVMDLAAMKAGLKRYIGYTFDGKDYVISSDLCYVENNKYYRKAIKNGDLKEYFKEI